MEPESDRESCDEVGGVPAKSSYNNAEEEDKNLSGLSHAQNDTFTFIYHISTFYLYHL